MVFFKFSNIGQFHTGIGHALGKICMWFAACIAAMIIGFYHGWQLALVNLSMTPVMALSGKIATTVK